MSYLIPVAAVLERPTRTRCNGGRHVAAGSVRPPAAGAGRMYVGNGYRLEPRTGPLDALAGLRVACLIDEQNLTVSARALGCEVDYEALVARLTRASRSVTVHAFTARFPGMPLSPAARALERAGCQMHVKPIVTLGAGRGVSANIDNLLLFSAGTVLTRGRIDAVVVASGDGDLVSDLAAGLHELPAARPVLTMSLPGSTSQRLRAGVNPHIRTNIEIGRDCLRHRSETVPIRARVCA